MSNLVERLRWWGAKRKAPKGMNTLPSDCREAADRIEELERQLAELTSEVNVLSGHLTAAIEDYNDARGKALEKAAQIAEREYKRHCTGSGFDSQPARSTAYAILQAIRALSDSTPTLLQEQNANAGKEKE